MGLNPFVVGICGFALNILLVRYLTQLDYGNYKLVLALINIMIITSIAGLNTSVVKSAAKGYPIFLKKATYTSFLFSFIGSFILIILAFTAYTNSGIKLALILSAIALPFLHGLNKWSSYFIGSEQFFNFFRANSIIQIGSVVVLGICAFYFHRMIWVLISYLVYTTICNFYLSRKAIRNINPQVMNKEQNKEYITYGFKITGINIIGIISKNIEKIILAAFSSPIAVATYSVATLMPHLSKQGVKSILNVPSMKLASIDEKNNRQIVKNRLWQILVLSFGFFLIGWFLLPVVIKTFFGEKYIEAIFYSQLLLISLIVFPSNILLINIPIYQGDTKSYAKLNIFVNVLRVVLFLALIPNFGIYGIILAIVGTDISYFFILIGWFLYTNKEFAI